MDVHRRRRRIAKLRERIAGPQDAYERCRAYPCTNRTTADRGEGLNRLYCRKHIEFYRRHGSYYKKSYGAGQLRPYRQKAMQWLQEREADPAIQRAVAGVRRLYASAGVPVEAFRLAGMSTRDRAKVTWAQLRKRQVDPLEVLAVWLAVDMRLQDDPEPDRHKEYRHVQLAKLIHRLAGGTHKRWERHRGDGSVEVTELHKHPVSRGQILRVVGCQLNDVCAGCLVLPVDLQP
jgi:hypothetical protein